MESQTLGIIKLPPWREAGRIWNLLQSVAGIERVNSVRSLVAYYEENGF